MLLLLAYRPLREAARQYPLATAGGRAEADLGTLLAEWSTRPPRALPETDPSGRITARDVTFGYEAAQPVLKNLSVSFGADRITGLTGPNGAGKTTLLRLISTAEIPDGGRILWPEALRARGVAYMPQRAWPGHDWAGWAVTLRASRPDDWRALDDLLGLERLTARAAHPETLSGGERQRMTLARVLASDAAYLLLDEPTTALPADERERVFRGALEFWTSRGASDADDGGSKPRRGALIVSHEPFLEKLCDTVVRLESGHT
jgi:iron complex transport system ATP-binding protein